MTLRKVYAMHTYLRSLKKLNNSLRSFITETFNEMIDKFLTALFRFRLRHEKQENITIETPETRTCRPSPILGF